MHALTLLLTLTRAVESGATRLPLVELYTSEGCSSCPPADDWLAQLPTDRLVPLAFHVDYWDELGWPDPFAQHAFAQRQLGRTRGGNLYTPEVFVDGRELHGRAQLDEALAQAGPPRAKLRLAVDSGVVRASAESAEPGARLYLAFYESGLRARPMAGENRGRTLRHEFVVRRLVGPRPVGVELREVAPAWAHGAVAFVEAADGDVLQSLRLPLR